MARKVLLVLWVLVLWGDRCFADEPFGPAERAPFRFAVISDLNPSCARISATAGLKKTIEVISSKINPLFVLIAGDMIGMSKGKKCLQASSYPKMWDAFMAEIEKLSEADIPVYVSPGNHDASYYNAAFREYEKVWMRYPHKPDFGDNDYYPFHYSFNIRGNHFISMPAYDLWFKGNVSKAKGWLIKDLEKVEEKKVSEEYDNVFLFQHVPIRDPKCKKGNEKIRDEKYAPILNGKVDVVFAGHQHCYRDDYADGVRQIVSGPSGDPSARGKNADMNFLVVDVFGPKDFKVYAVTEDSDYTMTFDGTALPPWPPTQ
ncbi:metallophosphoesterase family protein [Elusimicrobiota bacterium]